MNKFFITAIIVFVAVSALVFLLGGNGQSDNLDSFAKCLTDKKIVMYGADWCKYCQNEKGVFGDSFRFVTYVECPDDPNRCLAAGIDGFPTWVFPSGKVLEGEQGLEKISRESACPLPHVRRGEQAD